MKGFLTIFLVLALTLPLLAKRPADALSQTVSLEWSDVPIRSAMRKLGESQGVSILVDRRVDPSLPISGMFREITIPEVVRGVLLSVTPPEKKLALTRLGDDVLYVAPSAYAQRLRTLSAIQHGKVAKLPETARRLWLRKSSLAWEERATPRTLLANLAEKYNLKILDSKRIPHDLWAAAAFSSLDLTDQFVLILGQLDLTWDFVDGKPNRIELKPLNLDATVLTKSYAVNERLTDKLEKVQEAFPDTVTDDAGSRCSVTAIAEVHEYLSPTVSANAEISLGSFRRPALPSQPSRKTTKKSQATTLISGKISGTFLPVFCQVCEKNGLEVEYSADRLLDAGVELDRNISVEVKNVTLEALLEAVAQAGGCAIIMEKNIVRLKAHVSSGK
ncbi:MAG: hypothetical protein Q4D98_12210 [Planctomycetia bacterium]|nr:hypothetical protein [Planctomycetia bacterium]